MHLIFGTSLPTACLVRCRTHNNEFICGRSVTIRLDTRLFFAIAEKLETQSMDIRASSRGQATKIWLVAESLDGPANADAIVTLMA